MIYHPSATCYEPNWTLVPLGAPTLATQLGPAPRSRRRPRGTATPRRHGALPSLPSGPPATPRAPGRRPWCAPTSSRRRRPPAAAVARSVRAVAARYTAAPLSAQLDLECRLIRPRDAVSEKGIRLVQKMHWLARAFPWKYRYKRLKLAQFLGQLGVFLTVVRSPGGRRSTSRARTRPASSP